MKKLTLFLILAMAGMLKADTPTFTTTPTPSITQTSTPTPTVTITITSVNTVTPNTTQTPHVVVYDNSSIQTMAAGLNSTSISYTIGAGASPVLLAYVFMPRAAQVDHVTQVTWNGIKMTKLLSNKIGSQSANPYELDTYGLMNAPTGTGSVVVTLSATQASETLVGMASYFNVKYPSNITGMNTRATGSLTGTFYTGLANGTLVSCFAVYDSAGQTTLAGNPPMTNRSIYSVGGSENVYMSIDDVRNYTAGTVPMNWVYNGASPDPVMNQGVELVPR